MRATEQREEELRRQISDLKARNEREMEVRGENSTRFAWRQPFCEEIDEVQIPANFREVLVDPFDGTQDPYAHLQAFQTQVYISGDQGESLKSYLARFNDATIRLDQERWTGQDAPSLGQDDMDRDGLAFRPAKQAHNSNLD
ncbi:hypothetical protein CR513_43007, partial [Mucuna pruriens]